MDNLTPFSALVIDAFTIAICLAIALRLARSALHPAWVFMGLHVYMVTFRVVQLYAGAYPMKATFTWPVTVNEVLRAAVSSDLGLLAMAVGWIGARAVLKRIRVAKPKVAVVSKSRLRIAAILALAIGVCGDLIIGRLEHTLRNTSWDTSGYLAATTCWPSWSVCLLHFLYGFPIPLLIVTGVVLAFVAIMTTGRFAVVISIIFLLLTWLSRRRNTKFPIALVPGCLLALALWLPMKPFTHMVYNGASVSDALNEALRQTYLEFGEKGAADLWYLDMSAAYMTLADVRGERYWGGTFLPLLVSPIPRIYWTEKPNIVQYLFDLQVPSRNTAKSGMSAGLVGEGYVNFGYPGVALYFFIAGFIYAFAYLRIEHSPEQSPARLLYIFFLAISPQVYRDGLVSAVWFPFVYGAPIAWTAVSHWIWPPRRRQITSRVPVRTLVEEPAEYVT
jgi:hypothetical protein